MKTKFKTVAMLLMSGVMLMAFTFARQEDAPSWEMDGAHSSVSFTTSHFFVPVEGAFDKFDGTLKFDPNNLEGSSADFKIEVSSVNTKDGKRDGHLKSKDFFDAKSYPNMTFKSTKFKKTTEKEFEMEGVLIIKDKSKNITIPFTLLNIMDHPMKKGSLIAGIKAKTTIKRTDFGVGTGDWAADKVVGDETEIRIIMELSRKK
jgi:polyisoprenoid-binding protein YceI